MIGKTNSMIVKKEEDYFDYFYFQKESEADTQVKFMAVGSPSGIALQYSYDKNTWSTMGANTFISITGDIGSRLYIRSTNRNAYFATNVSNYWHFMGTGEVSVGGNILRLLSPYPDVPMRDYIFGPLFLNYADLIDASALKIPFTEFTVGCCRQMFQSCTKLKKAPELHATSIGNTAYHSMFKNCTSLEVAPELIADTVGDSGYQSMFDGCTSLKQASDIQATVLGKSACVSMFSGCTSLVNAPEINAETTSNSCFESMFANCTSLKTPPTILKSMTAQTNYARLMFSGCSSLLSTPQLPATSLYANCYQNMFENCVQLRTIPTLPAIVGANSCYYNMFIGCYDVKVSETQTEQYTIPWKIPDGFTIATYSLSNMFKNTGGTFTGNPVVGTTYYVWDYDA